MKAIVGPFETTVSLDQGFAGIVEAFKTRRASQGPAADANLDTLVARIVADCEREGDGFSVGLRSRRLGLDRLDQAKTTPAAAL